LVENKGRCSGDVTNFDWSRRGIYDNGTVHIDDQLISNFSIQLLPMDDLGTLNLISWNTITGPVQTSTSIL